LLSGACERVYTSALTFSACRSRELAVITERCAAAERAIMQLTSEAAEARATIKARTCPVRAAAPPRILTSRRCAQALEGQATMADLRAEKTAAQLALSHSRAEELARALEASQQRAQVRPANVYTPGRVCSAELAGITTRAA